MSQKSRERERQRHPTTYPDTSRCATPNCPNRHEGFRHRDTGLWYCKECAKRINLENNYELVIQPAPMDYSMAGIMGMLIAASKKPK